MRSSGLMREQRRLVSLVHRCLRMATDFIKVIMTSYLFPDGEYSQERLDSSLKVLGNDRSKLVIDLSCRRKDDSWFVAINKWQTLTEFEVNAGKCDTKLITKGPSS